MRLPVTPVTIWIFWPALYSFWWQVQGLQPPREACDRPSAGPAGRSPAPPAAARPQSGWREQIKERGSLEAVYREVRASASTATGTWDNRRRNVIANYPFEKSHRFVGIQ